MKMIQIQSSNIESVGYDPETKILEITFNNKSIYQYNEVPKSIYDSLMKTNKEGGSVGRYFLANVKGVYEFSRIA